METNQQRPSPVAMEDPREDARKYIESMGITKLFKELGTRVIYHRPKDPNAFLLEVLQNLRKAKEGNTPTTFFTPQDIEAMFSMFDPTQRGHIGPSQYEQALKTLGIDKPRTKAPQGKRITKEKFKKWM
ncbi:unnamed protein product [Choristocarpus tenellus]